MVAAAVFYAYRNYSDVPKLFVYSLLQQNNEIRENWKIITVLDVVTLITLLVGKPLPWYLSVLSTQIADLFGQAFSAALRLEKCDPIYRRSVGTAATNVITNIEMYGLAKLVIFSYFYPDFNSGYITDKLYQ